MWPRPRRLFHAPRVERYVTEIGALSCRKRSKHNKYTARFHTCNERIWIRFQKDIVASVLPTHVKVPRRHGIRWCQSRNSGHSPRKFCLVVDGRENASTFSQHTWREQKRRVPPKCWNNPSEMGATTDGESAGTLPYSSTYPTQ